MNIIIVGAGNVGSTIAGVLSSSHNVLMIEMDTKKTEAVKAMLNVSVLHENGVNPRVIEEAVGRHSADVLIAAMPADEHNLFSCIAAKNVKKNIRTVAKIRDPDFIRAMEGGGYFGADQIMSPELSAAKKISKLALIENAVDYEEAESIGLAMAVFRVSEGHADLIGKVVMNIRLPNDCAIVTIYRNNDVRVCRETTEILLGDLLCIFGTPSAIRDFNRMMGYPREAKEIVIIGGGVIGSNVARTLDKEKKYIKLIEQDAERCRMISRMSDNVLVVNANGVDPNILRSENAGRAD
ncbi:MAG: NAD-binding protein, partial [Methanomassiliicoccaceae archaeon]|nr:NAD-binding protein [Methanomassiliicoccaceae archaeon]